MCNWGYNYRFFPQKKLNCECILKFSSYHAAPMYLKRLKPILAAFLSLAPKVLLNRKKKINPLKLSVPHKQYLFINSFLEQTLNDDEDESYFVETSPASFRESIVQCYDIAWLKKREKIYQPKQYYLNWHPNLDPLMRAILLDWIYEVPKFSDRHKNLYLKGSS